MKLFYPNRWGKLNLLIDYFLGNSVAILWHLWTFNYFHFLIFYLDVEPMIRKKNICLQYVTKLGKISCLPTTLANLSFFQ